MAWQDIIITIVAVIFSYALIPQVYKGFKTKKQAIVLQTSLITFLALYVLAISYLTLDLFFSSITTFITGTLWMILFIQRVIYKK